VDASGDRTIRMTWHGNGASLTLEVDFARCSAWISDAAGRRDIATWRSETNPHS
jgi:hypothetical protein